MSADDRPEGRKGIDLEGALHKLSELANHLQREYTGASSKKPNQAKAYLRAKGEYKERRRRTLNFPHEILGEPGWDILLDLYILHHEGKRVSVTSACIGSTAPNSTALRWINLLSEMGFLSRVASSSDKRVCYLRLTPKALIKLERHFSGDEDEFSVVPWRG